MKEDQMGKEILKREDKHLRVEGKEGNGEGQRGDKGE
jgi:hypothetical protein